LTRLISNLGCRLSGAPKKYWRSGHTLRRTGAYFLLMWRNRQYCLTATATMWYFLVSCDRKTMNKFVSHCIIQILIIVLGFLGVAQALPGLCATECICCAAQESVQPLPACCSGQEELHASHLQTAGQQNAQHASAHQDRNGGPSQQTADHHDTASQEHATTQDDADCTYAEICASRAEPAAHDVRLATTGGQSNGDIAPALVDLVEIAHGLTDFSAKSPILRPYQAPLHTPPLIYTKNCSFLI